MGGVFSLTRRKKHPKSLTGDYDTKLQELDKIIDNITQQRQTHRTTHNTISRAIVWYGFIALLLASAATYLFLLDSRQRSIKARSQQLAPVFALTIFLYLLKRLVDTYYNKRLSQDDIYLKQLETRKDEWLEELMEVTDYKKTEKLIEQYKKKQQLTLQTPNANTSSGSRAQPTPMSSVKQMANAINNNGRMLPPGSAMKPSNAMQTPAAQRHNPPQATPYQQIPPTPMWTESDNRQYLRTDVAPIAVIQKPRTIIDKFVDALLNDGPNNRYALICSACGAHNGLVREEDKSLKFRCAFCYAVNHDKPGAASSSSTSVATLPADAVKQVVAQHADRTISNTAMTTGNQHPPATPIQSSSASELHAMQSLSSPEPTKSSSSRRRTSGNANGWVSSELMSNSKPALDTVDEQSTAITSNSSSNDDAQASRDELEPAVRPSPKPTRRRSRKA